jgi:hypothetical protein
MKQLQRTTDFTNDRIYRTVQEKLEQIYWHDELWQDSKWSYSNKLKERKYLRRTLRRWKYSVSQYPSHVSIGIIKFCCLIKDAPTSQPAEWRAVW